MTKTSTLEGGWNGPRVQVIAPHDQCLRWVKLRRTQYEHMFSALLELGHSSMQSALRFCVNQTSRASFDHLICAAEQRDWDCEAERLGGLEVYKQLNFRRL